MVANSAYLSVSSNVINGFRVFRYLLAIMYPSLLATAQKRIDLSRDNIRSGKFS
ncbi:hypothetical protein Ngar_c04350 [Candidatus Nitrososphaera gargensis Ga9.2]|uniref:Uncharacterized protein n=1 Tax=Nitrososphaera gargensis (strain Ga9.2) TaxID=1237085 RepID=K0IHR8_NITGG|nr:hypothetical protein Ngar_c04350 [Candidatus Nitrososphaera gargensis Ga9.2]